MAGFLLFAVALQAAEPVMLSGRAMGTTWSAKFISPSGTIDSAALERRIAARLETLEQQFSLYRANSELARFNSVANVEWRPVSPELARVAAEARRISEMTAGAYDPTVAPLVSLWGFGRTRRLDALPAETEIAAARARVGWTGLEVRPEPPAFRKTRAGLAVDFSSIAKGFAVDELGELLRSAGVTNFLVQLAGDVRATGGGPEENGWRIGIEQPDDPRRALAGVVALGGGELYALSTSGNYQNFITVNSRRFGHLIDPRTGWPAANGLVAVTVAHASCAWSSALATGLFVLGQDEGFRVAVRHRLACQFLVRNGASLVPRRTPEFERLTR